MAGVKVAGVKVGIIGGSGFYKLDSLEDKVVREVTTPFGSPSSHPVEGTLCGVQVVVLARHGTHHSIPPGEVNYRANIWALKELGVTHILAATACGSLKEEIRPGMFVILNSFIDRTSGRSQSFYSADGLPGVCHTPMEPAFCTRTRQLVVEECKALGFEMRETGTAVTIQGPRFSSRAESNMFRMWGADVVNMTTVPEVVLAKEAGLSYTSIALPTDYDCWKDTVVDQQGVLAVFASNISRVKTLLEKVVARIGSEEWEDMIKANLTMAANSIIMGSQVERK
eukprot:GFUD01007684.1.p1 GENE.GFUD01007684.1~~GFUD01007684.1.p1  ORF type:complete len:283 (+),score=106.26 GFUD01007684.1:145-993(+)